MYKFYLFLVNIALGLMLAILTLIQPNFDSAVKTRFLVLAVVYINWAVFTWLAYSSAFKEKQLSATAAPSPELPQDTTAKRQKRQLDVVTVACLLVIFLALVSLNAMVLLEVTAPSWLVWIILVTVLVPLLVAWITNKRATKVNQK